MHVQDTFKGRAIEDGEPDSRMPEAGADQGQVASVERDAARAKSPPMARYFSPCARLHEKLLSQVSCKAFVMIFFGDVHLPRRLIV